MAERTIKTVLKLEGVEQYRAEIRSICSDLKYLDKHIEVVNKSLAQLNESMRELAKLRKDAI